MISARTSLAGKLKNNKNMNIINGLGVFSTHPGIHPIQEHSWSSQGGITSLVIIVGLIQSALISLSSGRISGARPSIYVLLDAF